MVLDFGHQLTGDALAAEVGVHQEFADFGPVRLVGGGVVGELNRSCDAAIVPGYEQQSPAIAHRGGNLVAPEIGALGAGMRNDETDAGASMHAGMGELSQIPDMPCDIIRIEQSKSDSR